MAYKERTTGVIALPTLVDEQQLLDFNDVETTTDTFTLTWTVGDSDYPAATVTSTTAITYVTTTVVADIEAILSEIGLDTDTVTITQDTSTTTLQTWEFIGDLAGYDVGAISITDATTFTPTATTVVVSGSSANTVVVPIGAYAEVKRIRLAGWDDNSLDASITDADGRTVFSKTGIDTGGAGTDVPYDKLLTADGVAGEDGAAAANTNSGVYKGPLTVTVTGSNPDRTGSVILFINDNAPGGGLRKRSSGALVGSGASGDGGDISLGAPSGIGVVRKVKCVSSDDTGVAPVVVDAYDFTVYTKSSTDYTTTTAGTIAGAGGLDLGHEGVDQAGNAVADLLEVVAKSPLSVSFGTSLATGTFTVEVVVET